MNDLKQIAKEIRKDTISCIASIGVGHIGGALSCVDILTALYFDLMNVNPKEPKMEGRDRLIVSKGHSGPAVYATLANKGYFDKSLLLTLNQGGTNLPSHCDMNRTVGIDMTTGSLGQGFSCAVGIALGSKIKKDSAYIYTIIGDGESQEGQIWEAAMFASKMKLNNLIAFTDYNKYQIDGSVEEINPLEPIMDKWKSFGFNTIMIDGHNFDEIIKGVAEAKKQDKPTMIIANTIKGKGVTFIEEKKAANHNMNISIEEAKIAIAEVMGE